MLEDKWPEWILCSEKLPPYDELVLVYRKICDRCYEENNDNHPHKMIHLGEKISVAKYHEKDLELVEYYNNKKDLTLVEYYNNNNDNSWDSFKEDYWSVSLVYAWMPLPKIPNKEMMNARR